VPFVLVTGLFFLWAIGVNLNDILIPHLKRVFSLTDFKSSFVQTAFFGGYFVAALPAGWVMERLGYKRGIVTGPGDLCFRSHPVHSSGIAEGLWVVSFRIICDGLWPVFSGSCC
jgi:MFS family permease